tara:strand:+ start:1865 stop:2317 length:453 start_codon:yes stop_codon:yes gene_type:complete
MGRYANTGEFNVLYPTRRRMATILKRIIRNDVVDGQGTLVESIRINAKITGFEKLEIQIIAMYYFIFLNNGAYLWNGGVITPRDYVAQFTDELNSAGITAEIYSQYTEWLAKRFPILEVADILEKNQRITYTFEAIDPPAGFQPGVALDV